MLSTTFNYSCSNKLTLRLGHISGNNDDALALRYYEYFSPPLVTGTYIAVMAAVAVEQTKLAIDEALRGTGYSCKIVSWDDVQRGEVKGTLSCWGSNITDTRLRAKDGTSLYTVRSDNWNEKLGVISANQFALLVGNCEQRAGAPLRNITLHDFLQTPFENGTEYSGLNASTVLAADADSKVSIRFQTVFLPVDLDSSTGRGTMQFATEAYNYSTHSDDDPRNLVVLATTQGLSVQADGKGSKRLFLHKRDENGNIGEYWLEAESTSHKVGGEQKETKEERADAIARGKAISEMIGIKAMGQRFNVLATIQIPLEQNKEQARVIPMACVGMVSMSAIESLQEDSFCNVEVEEEPILPLPPTGSWSNHLSRSVGVSRAARVSRGDYHGEYSGLSITEPKRNHAEHVTITCVLYNTVTGGVPSPEDCMAAIEDLNKLYSACTESGKLADTEFDFMKKELTVGDMLNIEEKVTTQPPTAPKPTNPVALVRTKLAEMKAASTLRKDDVLKLKLLTLGALKDEDTKKVLVPAFDQLSSALGTKDEAYELTTISTMIEGALDSEIFSNFN